MGNWLPTPRERAILGNPGAWLGSTRCARPRIEGSCHARTASLKPRQWRGFTQASLTLAASACEATGAPGLERSDEDRGERVPPLGRGKTDVGNVRGARGNPRKAGRPGLPNPRSSPASFPSARRNCVPRGTRAFRRSPKPRPHRGVLCLTSDIRIIRSRAAPLFVSSVGATRGARYATDTEGSSGLLRDRAAPGPISHARGWAGITRRRGRVNGRAAAVDALAQGAQNGRGLGDQRPRGSGPVSGEDGAQDAPLPEGHRDA